VAWVGVSLNSRMGQHTAEASFAWFGCSHERERVEALPLAQALLATSELKRTWEKIGTRCGLVKCPGACSGNVLR